MRATSIAIALGLLACTASARPRELALDSLLDFADPTMCRETPAHARFLQSMIAGDADSGFRAGQPIVPRKLEPAFGAVQVRRHDGWWTIGIPIQGSLFGLPLVRIDHALPEGGDPGSVTYTFRAPVYQAERALRARGFPARANADVQLGEPSAYDLTMSLLPDPDNAQQSLFSCGFS